MKLIFFLRAQISKCTFLELKHTEKTKQSLYRSENIRNKNEIVLRRINRIHAIILTQNQKISI